MSEKIIFHLDVNSAFLSWSAVRLLKNGEKTDIRKVPSIIGGSGDDRHGIVLAKSPSAKKSGIRTGETIKSAMSKCQNLVVEPPDYEYYSKMSKDYIGLLNDFTPDIEQVSIDECYMDFTGISKFYDSPEDAAYIIKEKVKEELGFTINVGVSDVKVLSKMASDFEKPDKVHTLYKSEIQEKMWPLPVSELFMAGRSSVEVLKKLGIHTIGQLANTPKEFLVAHLKSHGAKLYEYANGIDDSLVDTKKEDLKNVGNSVTLSRDISKKEEIDKVLLGLSEKVAGRLRKRQQTAGTIAVEVKYYDFTKASKQTTLDVKTDVTDEIYDTSKSLFYELWNEKPIRLLGIRTSMLAGDDEPEQMTIDSMFLDGKSQGLNNAQKPGPSNEKLKKLDKAVDAIRGRYGSGALKRASLMEEERKQKSEE